MPSTDTSAGGRTARRSVAVRLGALQAANFAGIGLYMPFFPVWLASQGLSDRQIGLALALGMVVRMLAAQPITALGDRRPGAVRTLAALQLLSAAAYGVLMLQSSPHAIIAGSVAVALISAGVIPLGDYLCGAQVRRDPGLDYGRIRLWGSVAFLVVSLAGGVMVAKAGVGAVPLGLIACCLVAAAAALAAPDAPSERRQTQTAAEDGEPPTKSRTAQAAARGRLLWALIIASALVNASHAAVYGFGSLHWRSIGIGDTMIGVLWAAGVVAEIAVFWTIGPRVARSLTSAMAALAVAAGASMLRFALLPLAADPAAVLALQATHALSFGAQHMAVIAIAAALAPPGRRALIQGRISAANACLMGAATLSAGFVYEAFGPLVFTAMVPIAAVGLAITLLSMRSWARLQALDSVERAGLPVQSDNRAA